ncbi:MAG: peroxiredoxin [Desulfurococcales archaeon]|nr:peroxiredoxin [Desulfurococcales archaeon]
MALKEGVPAPDFEAETHKGDKIRLSSLKGKIVVLYFYPRAMTPGCTREARRFEELYEEFNKLGAVIIGVSTDTVERLKKFAGKEGLNHIILASDPQGEIAAKYDVLRKGKKRVSAERVTFIIDEQGIIRKVLQNIRPAEKHADLALETVKTLASGKGSACPS